MQSAKRGASAPTHDRGQQGNLSTQLQAYELVGPRSLGGRCLAGGAARGRHAFGGGGGAGGEHASSNVAARVRRLIQVDEASLWKFGEEHHRGVRPEAPRPEASREQGRIAWEEKREDRSVWEEEYCICDSHDEEARSTQQEHRIVQQVEKSAREEDRLAREEDNSVREEARRESEELEKEVARLTGELDDHKDLFRKWKEELTHAQEELHKAKDAPDENRRLRRQLHETNEKAEAMEHTILGYVADKERVAKRHKRLQRIGFHGRLMTYEVTMMVQVVASWQTAAMRAKMDVWEDHVRQQEELLDRCRARIMAHVDKTFNGRIEDNLRWCVFSWIENAAASKALRKKRQAAVERVSRTLATNADSMVKHWFHTLARDAKLNKLDREARVRQRHLAELGRRAFRRLTRKLKLVRLWEAWLLRTFGVAALCQ